MRNLETRIVGLIVISSAIMYISWLFGNINPNNLPFSILFLATSIFNVISSIILVINNWRWRKPYLYPLPPGREKKVGILIPTWKESPEIVRRTILSIIGQDYPAKMLYIIVSDDARNPEMRSMAERLNNQYQECTIRYHIPPEKNSKDRRGEGKAGNLNSALQLVKEMEDIEYIETRDADDLVGSKRFLQFTVGQLESFHSIAYVQTIKEANGGKIDWFSNDEPLFYKSLMLSKNATNSVFPCGSGLVWRKAALRDIGGFPFWNVVEDVQSGVEALKKGWKGEFLPIRGALAQVANEDMPNVYKQRGTWALDSIRFLLFGNKRGLNLWQRLQFFEQGWFYIFSGVFTIQTAIPIIVLLTNQQPVLTSGFDYFINITPYLASIYLFILALERKQGIKYLEIFRSFLMALGLGPIYIWAFFKALIYGPKRKPKYVVTRKFNVPGIYTFYTIPQLLIVGLLVYAVYKNIEIATSDISKLEIVTILWAVAHIYTFTYISILSVFNFSPRKWLQQQIASLFVQT